MSAWESEGRVDSEISRDTGELMISASDVLAWIRSNANTHAGHPCNTDRAYHALADALADSMLDATLGFVDGSES